LGLPSHHEERNAGLVCEQDHLGGSQDGLVFPEAASLAQLPLDANPEDRYVWDASGDVHPDATVDGFRRDLPDADAGKSADLELDARAQDD